MKKIDVIVYEEEVVLLESRPAVRCKQQDREERKIWKEDNDYSRPAGENEKRETRGVEELYLLSGQRFI